MKEFVLKEKSWHHKLATFGSYQWEKEHLVSQGSDICTYIRMVLIGLFKITLIAAIFGGLSIWFVIGIYDTIQFLFYKTGFTAFSATFMAAVFVSSILGSFIFVAEKIKKRKQQYVQPKDPTFMTLAYRKFKDKTCSKVVFK